MYFKLGKQYIVSVSEDGIVPVDEFDKDKYYNKDTDDLNILKDEEKLLIFKSVCNSLIKKIDRDLQFYRSDLTCKTAAEVRAQITEIIEDYYKNNKESINNELDLDSIKERILSYEDFSSYDREIVKNVFDMIKNADAKPVINNKTKEAEWVHSFYSEGNKDIYKCSACGRLITIDLNSSDTLSNYPYCHCGAHMSWIASHEYLNKENKDKS